MDINLKNTSEIKMSRLAYSQDILNKRYDLYTWTDGKARLALTINGILLTFSYWIITKSSTSLISQILLVIGVIFLGRSMLILLSVILPAMKSPLWKTEPEKLIEKQPRTVVGVDSFSSIEEYHSEIKSLSIDKMIKYNTDQIWKMNKIVVTSSENVKSATIYTRLAVIVLIGGLISAFLTNAEFVSKLFSLISAANKVI